MVDFLRRYDLGFGAGTYLPINLTDRFSFFGAVFAETGGVLSISFLCSSYTGRSPAWTTGDYEITFYSSGQSGSSISLVS